VLNNTTYLIAVIENALLKTVMIQIWHNVHVVDTFVLMIMVFHPAHANSVMFVFIQMTTPMKPNNLKKY